MSDPLIEALASLPHGPEFRFLDRLIELTPGHSAVGEYTVRGEEPFLRGHFPGRPLFPGVLLVEAAAQLAGTAAQTDARLGPLADLRLTALRAVKILGSARPGEVILLRARVVSRLGALIQAEATASINGQPVLEAQITLSGRPAS